MGTKTDKREAIRRKRKNEFIHHGIGAWSPDFIHLRKEKKKKASFRKAMTKWSDTPKKNKKINKYFKGLIK